MLCAKMAHIIKVTLYIHKFNHRIIVSSVKKVMKIVLKAYQRYNLQSKKAQ